MSDYDALVVDFGGVLTTPVQESMQLFAEENGIDFNDLVRATLAVYSGGEDDLVSDFETGRIPEDEFARRFAGRLSAACGRDIAAENIVERMLGRLSLEEPMLDAVAAARRAGLKTGLLSNSWGVQGYPRERFESLFDEVVISGEVGLRKPDPAIFELMTERLGVEPGRCIFVDDHPGHLKGALEHGMVTVLHRDPAQTIAELEDLLGLSLRV